MADTEQTALAKANNDTQEISIESAESDIKTMIYVIRNQQVMIDSDLAMLYQVETRVLNQAVKRNISRFPERFRFQLTNEEYENLKSQFVTSSFVASYIPKLEIPNRNTKFYVRLLFAFTVYHTFFYEDSHNLAIFAEKEDKTICLSELPYPLFPYIFFANVFSNAAISGLASSFRSISWSVCDVVSAFVSSCASSAAGAALL